MDIRRVLKNLAANHEEIQSMGRNGKVLLVDGLNSYLRCFAATTTMDDNGKHIGGMQGFMLSLAATIRLHKPTRVVVVFDGVGGSLRRRKLFPEYKANRRNMTRLNRFYDFQSIEDEKESIQWQLKVLVVMLRLLPITVIMADHVEADDVLAYLAQNIADEGGQAIIMSTDKDFLQLVTEKSIAVWNPIKKKMYRPANILEDYGFHPNNFLLYRMVTGDSSDGIPGVGGIKEKTLLKFFPVLAEEVPRDAAFLLSESAKMVSVQKKPPVALTTLMGAREVLERNHELMRLDEVQMSSQTRIAVMEQFHAPVPRLDKVQLTKFIMAGKMVNAFNNFDQWLHTTFVPLMRFRGESTDD